MSKGRLQNSRRKTRKSNLAKETQSKSFLLKSNPTSSASQHRFLGVSLAGGKTDRTSIAVIEYFPDHKKVFLARLFDRIKNEVPHFSSDSRVHEIISQYQGEAESLAFDVPLSLPKCLRCNLKCPGFDICNEVEIKWLRSTYEKINKKKRPKRFFTPYTQRCTETYFSLLWPDIFELQHAMGSNLAPLVARALYIKRRLSIECIEVIPKLTVWKLGQDLKVNKSLLKFHRHSVRGEESRKAFLEAISEKGGVFIYQQDLKIMQEHFQAFDAFICAYTAYLKFRGQTLKRPNDFPNQEQWIEVPV